MPLIFDMGLEPFLSGDTSNPLLNPGILRSVLAERRQVLRDIEDREFRKRMADHQEKMDLENLRLKGLQVGFEGKRLDLEENRFGLAKKEFETRLQQDQAGAQLLGQVGSINTSGAERPEDVERAIKFRATVQQAKEEQTRRIVANQSVRGFVSDAVENGYIPPEVGEQLVVGHENGELSVEDVLETVQIGRKSQQELNARKKLVGSVQKVYGPIFEGDPEFADRLQLITDSFELGQGKPQEFHAKVEELIEEHSRYQLFRQIGIPDLLAKSFAHTGVSVADVVDKLGSNNIGRAIARNPEIALRVVGSMRGELAELYKQRRDYEPGGIKSESFLSSTIENRRERDEAISQVREERKKILDRIAFLERTIGELEGFMVNAVRESFQQQNDGFFPFLPDNVQTASPKNVQTASPEVEPDATSTGFVVNKRGDTFYVETPNDGKANGRWRLNRVPGTMDDAMRMAFQILGPGASREEVIELAQVIWSATR